MCNEGNGNWDGRPDEDRRFVRAVVMIFLLEATFARTKLIAVRAFSVFLAVRLLNLRLSLKGRHHV